MNSMKKGCQWKSQIMHQ
ncbi:hypothetical protein Goarm_019249, partial [Gossypium armourianum]|nr:hypothetical protein [Gossypium armourianum]